VLLIGKFVCLIFHTIMKHGTRLLIPIMNCIVEKFIVIFACAYILQNFFPSARYTYHRKIFIYG